MEEEIEGNGGIQQHAAGTNNAEGRDAQQAMQYKEGDQGGVDIDKDNRQNRVDKTPPGHASHTESYH